MNQKKVSFQELLFPLHHHGTLDEQDSLEILYREKDVLKLLEIVRIRTLEEASKKSRIAILELSKDSIEI